MGEMVSKGVPLYHFHGAATETLSTCFMSDVDTWSGIQRAALSRCHFSDYHTIQDGLFSDLDHLDFRKGYATVEALEGRRGT